MVTKTAKSFTPSSFCTASLKVKQLKADLTEDEKMLTLVMDMNSFSRALEHMNRDLTIPANWKDLGPVDIAMVLWCSLHRFHPEITIEEAKRLIPLEHTAELFNMLIELCFPGIIEQLAKASSGEMRPNAISAPSQS